jgi:phage terminase large subunit-like protein
MVVDPNHGGSDGRARHAIVVTGFDPETDRIYLLDLWAKSMSYDDLMANIYKIATTWNLGEFWLETIAAQKYLKYHIEYRNKIENRRLTVRELKSEHSKNAKRTRIEALEPLFREGRFWVRNDQAEFLDEYYDYPGGRTVDILDCLGYATQTWNAIHAKRILDMMRQRKERWKGYNGAKPKA